MEVLAACKYKLRYEWVKRIIEKDLLSKSPKVYHDPELVGLGCQLVDEILEHKTVEYQCIISCPTTNKKVLSDPARVPVCSALKQDKSLPEFKIALLICQEDYDQADFLNLQAPRGKSHALKKYDQFVLNTVTAPPNKYFYFLSYSGRPCFDKTFT